MLGIGCSSSSMSGSVVHLSTRSAVPAAVPTAGIEDQHLHVLGNLAAATISRQQICPHHMWQLAVTGKDLYAAT